MAKKLKGFAPDCAIAQSWQRLTEGKPEPHDLTLIKHEIMEKELMDQGMSQREAHIVTSRKYSYEKEADAYYGNLKANKDKRK